MQPQSSIRYGNLGVGVGQGDLRLNNFAGRVDHIEATTFAGDEEPVVGSQHGAAGDSVFTVGSHGIGQILTRGKPFFAQARLPRLRQCQHWSKARYQGHILGPA